MDSWQGHLLGEGRGIWDKGGVGELVCGEVGRDEGQRSSREETHTLTSETPFLPTQR